MNTNHYHLLTDDELERLARNNTDPLVQELLQRWTDRLDEVDELENTN